MHAVGVDRARELDIVVDDQRRAVARHSAVSARACSRRSVGVGGLVAVLHEARAACERRVDLRAAARAVSASSGVTA